LIINQDIKDAISENIRKEALRELVYNSDVITLLQDGLQKVADGLTTFEEILKIIELEVDEKLADTYSLKTALDYTNITHNSENNNVEKTHDYSNNNFSDVADNNIGNMNDTNEIANTNNFSQQSIESQNNNVEFNDSSDNNLNSNNNPFNINSIMTDNQTINDSIENIQDNKLSEDTSNIADINYNFSHAELSDNQNLTNNNLNDNEVTQQPQQIGGINDILNRINKKQSF